MKKTQTKNKLGKVHENDTKNVNKGEQKIAMKITLASKRSDQSNFP